MPLENSHRLDYHELTHFRQHHPAWRLLRADNAVMVASFLDTVFLAANRRTVAESELTEALEDYIYGLHQMGEDERFPRSASEYLNDWANPDQGWLRKFYISTSDEPQFDLTPSTEKALGWLSSLGERTFVGTESRLLTLFSLVREMAEGVETDPDLRIAELESRRAQIDEEIKRISSGDLPMLDSTALKDRFLQFSQMARELLSDFRQVEHNFRGLDRRVREMVSTWEGSKGQLLEQIMGERDAIADSDQGKSFHGFWDFLMTPTRQEELTANLDKLLQQDAIRELKPDPRTRRLHYDWLEAGEHTQRTVAELSSQLRRFLDDRAWLENRRIMELLRSVEKNTLGLAGNHPRGPWMDLPAMALEIELPMEKPLFQPTAKPVLDPGPLEVAVEDLDPSALFNQFVVDTRRLRSTIDRMFLKRSQFSLGQLLDEFPLEQGLAELTNYLQLAVEEFDAAVDADTREWVQWLGVDTEGRPRLKRVSIPQMLFLRRARV